MIKSEHIPGDEKPKTYSHWTSYGVFWIRPEYAGTVSVWNLYVNEQYLGSFSSAWQAAYDLFKGKFDDQLTANAKYLEIPEDYREWNNRA